MNRSRLSALGVLAIGVAVSAHVGSPDVFFSGKAGPYDVSVVVRPPQVVPGIARVTVRAPLAVTGVGIRPVYWRAGSKGSPTADQMRRQPDAAERATFDGSLWLMASGAYTVDVIVDGPQGEYSVQVPVASVATGRLVLSKGFGAVLVVFGVFLFVGLVNIVRKASGEALTEPGRAIDDKAARTSKIAGGAAVVVFSLALFLGSRWWDAVDRDYESSIYAPSPMMPLLAGRNLELAVTDRVYLPGGRPAVYVPDHGKPMHLFMIKADDAKVFAHLHPTLRSEAEHRFVTTVPPLPAGTYRLFGDVVHETGFERTLVGTLDLPPPTAGPFRPADADDAWFVGDAVTTPVATLSDGTTMRLAATTGQPAAGAEVTLRLAVMDAKGNPVRLEPYLGMPAHAVVAKLDGSVYIHLHPMGTVTMAARDVFAARDRGDTTPSGRLRAPEHSAHVPAPTTVAESLIEFPYAFPTPGEYRVFAQVRRNGRILTAAFVVSVAAPEAR